MAKIDISIHAPARGATSDNRKHYSTDSISIHAPARGATPPIFLQIVGDIISIHAPARGATDILVSEIIFDQYFNPRSREGSDFFVSVLAT